MGRAAIAWLMLGAAALAQTPAAEAPAPVVDAARCDEAKRGGPALAPAEVEACRDGWTKLIEESRARSKAWREEAARLREERRAAAKARAEGRAGVTSIERFLDDDLAYGDIVVTDQGPRVFVGKSYSGAQPQDFVPLESPRSPHRNRAESVRRATRPPSQP
ncbi:MAG: hypothetical protein JNK46_10430 [Methylobacteriaceae bacterium]|nr:hypothetical protein [Methylobacteriaceae bacterium]